MPLDSYLDITSDHKPGSAGNTSITSDSVHAGGRVHCKHVTDYEALNWHIPKLPSLSLVNADMSYVRIGCKEMRVTAQMRWGSVEELEKKIRKDVVHRASRLVNFKDSKGPPSENVLRVFPKGLTSEVVNRNRRILRNLLETLEVSDFVVGSTLIFLSSFLTTFVDSDAKRRWIGSEDIAVVANDDPMLG
ncbi:hypothetical protein Tco_0505658 [Tanacetum coccineum]